ncbi:MAG: hypothetical protein ACFFAU_17715 [Candidatus Hodarchaeota archaeon]
MIEQSMKISSINQDEFNKTKDELEAMLSNFGWKWAVLASTAGDLYGKNGLSSTNVINQLRMTRTQIESGCYSVCDIANELRKIEIELFSHLIKYGTETTDQFLELLAKALSGKLTSNDIDITAATPILPDCLTLPCVCREQTFL